MQAHTHIEQTSDILQSPAYMNHYCVSLDLRRKKSITPNTIHWQIFFVTVNRLNLLKKCEGFVLL